jgi:phage repressor protein C with HTH and peptisase S24 domain
MSEKEFIPDLILPVSGEVNTARIEKTVTICIEMGDDRQDVIKARAERLKAYRLAAGFKHASDAATRYHWKQAGYRHHENGTRSIGDDDADRYAAAFSRPGRKITGKDIMYGPAENPAEPQETGVVKVAVVGLVGAGGDIEPEFEQVPEGGLFEVELPFAVPVELVGFQIDGDSMLPKYEEGDVILVWRDQRKSLESFYGREAVVRTSDGHRYIKQILHGKSRNLVNLHSLNAKIIEGVRLEWIGEIYSIIKADQVHQIHKRARARAPHRREISR